MDEDFWLEPKPAYEVKVAEDWHADGVVVHFDRGCKGGCSGAMECTLALRESGIPVITYESSNADPRDFADADVFNRLDSFMESLGLTKLAE